MQFTKEKLAAAKLKKKIKLSIYQVPEILELKNSLYYEGLFCYYYTHLHIDKERNLSHTSPCSKDYKRKRMGRERQNVFCYF